MLLSLLQQLKVELLSLWLNSMESWEWVGQKFLLEMKLQFSSKHSNKVYSLNNLMRSTYQVILDLLIQK